MDKVAFFLPTRKGSEHVKNKNTYPFAGIDGGLVENKIRQLLESRLIDEIILSTNDEKCMAVAEKYMSDRRLRIIPRPDELCLTSTSLQNFRTVWGDSLIFIFNVLYGTSFSAICGKRRAA